jgi:catechol 2,3-dioxygenase-like lactoylglutathione lyase family enzyme
LVATDVVSRAKFRIHNAWVFAGTIRGNMAKEFTISRVGHVGIHVTDLDRSLAWYRDILGLTLTGRWPFGGGEMAFMRFGSDHHNIVLFTHPTKVTAENRNTGYNALQHIALEVDSCRRHRACSERAQRPGSERDPGLKAALMTKPLWPSKVTRSRRHGTFAYLMLHVQRNWAPGLHK